MDDDLTDAAAVTPDHSANAPAWVRGPDPSLPREHTARTDPESRARVRWVHPTEAGQLARSALAERIAKLAPPGLFGRSRSTGKDGLSR